MIQYDWCPYERGNLDTEIDMNKRKTREETQGEERTGNAFLAVHTSKLTLAMCLARGIMGEIRQVESYFEDP